MWYGLPLSFHQPSQTATAHLSQPRVYVYDFPLWRRSCLQQDVWKADANNPTTVLPYLLKSECTTSIKSSQDVTQGIIVSVQSAAALCTVNSSRNSTQIYIYAHYLYLIACQNTCNTEYVKQSAKMIPYKQASHIASVHRIITSCAASLNMVQLSRKLLLNASLAATSFALFAVEITHGCRFTWRHEAGSENNVGQYNERPTPWGPPGPCLSKIQRLRPRPAALLTS